MVSPQLSLLIILTMQSYKFYLTVHLFVFPTEKHQYNLGQNNYEIPSKKMQILQHFDLTSSRAGLFSVKIRKQISSH